VCRRLRCAVVLRLFAPSMSLPTPSSGNRAGCHRQRRAGCHRHEEGRSGAPRRHSAADVWIGPLRQGASGNAIGVSGQDEGRGVGDMRGALSLGGTTRIQLQNTGRIDESTVQKAIVR
jgi:hypothetical protein